MPAVVSIKMQATDEASAKIAKVRREVDGLGKSGGGGGAAGIAGGALDSIAGAMPQLAAGATLAAIAATSWQLGELGAQTLRVRENFGLLAENANISASGMLQAMRTATAGTISDTQLMLAANKAMMLGVATNADDLAALMSAAIERGRAMGVSAGDAVNQVVEGIGKMSPERLDDLGITGVAAQMEAYAATLGKTSDQLTDVQKKQALVKAVIESSTGGPVGMDAAAAFERMDAAIQNAKEALGVMFSPAISAIANKLAEAVSGVTNEIQRNAMIAAQADLAAYGDSLTTNVDALQRWQDALAIAQIDGDPAQIQNAQMMLDMLRTNIDGIATAYNVAAAVTRAPLIDPAQAQEGTVAFFELSTAITGTGAAATGADPQLVQMAAGLGLIGQMALQAATDVATFKAEVARLTGIANAIAGAKDSAISQAMSMGQRAIEAGASPDEAIAKVKATAEAVDGLILSTDQDTEAQFRNKLAVDAALSGLDGYTTGLEDANRAAEKYASGGLKSVEDRYSKIESAAASVISGAMNLGVEWEGMNGAAGGDGVNENAKRLADIANKGFAGQEWLDEFKAEVPDIYQALVDSGDPKAAAQSMMQRFQLGELPQLLDREMIKDKVRKALMGDANMQQLAQEIAAELAAEGTAGLNDAMSATQKVMGLSPTEGGAGTTSPDVSSQGNAAGASYQVGFIAGFASSDTALKIIGGIDKGFKDNAGAVQASGKAVAAVWGENFMATVGTNIPSALIAVLTSLVTPAVWAQIQANQGLTTPAS